MQKTIDSLQKTSSVEEVFPYLSTMLEAEKSIEHIVFLNTKIQEVFSQTCECSTNMLDEMLEQRNRLVRSYPIANKFYMFIFYKHQLEDDTDIRLLLQVINLQYKDELEILRRENKLIKNVISAIPEILAFKDISGTYRYLSKEAEEYYDKFDKVEGHTVQELYSKNEAKIVSELDMEVIRKKEKVRRQIKIDTKDGFIDVDSIRSPVYDDDDDDEVIVVV